MLIEIINFVGSSDNSNISLFPALILFTELKYLIPTFLIGILYSIAFQGLMYELKETRKEIRYEINKK